jgi:hypothetical protein
MPDSAALVVRGGERAADGQQGDAADDRCTL